jgi:hypothetical protein
VAESVSIMPPINDLILGRSSGCALDLVPIGRPARIESPASRNLPRSCGHDTVKRPRQRSGAQKSPESAFFDVKTLRNLLYCSG